MCVCVCERERERERERAWERMSLLTLIRENIVYTTTKLECASSYVTLCGEITYMCSYVYVCMSLMECSSN